MTVPGDRIDVELRAAVPGGAMIGSIPDDPQRRTVFVRHGLPGERGTAEVTAVRGGGRILFADLVGIGGASPDRVPPPCPASGPGGCGGCDYQHVALAAQRGLKADVLADSLRRIARLDLTEVPWDGAVGAVPGDVAGLRWRTRSRFLPADGGLAMRRHRSHEVIPITDCPIARAEVVAAAAAVSGGAVGEVAAVASSAGEVVAGEVGRLASRQVHEHVAGSSLRVAADGFWQVHPGAPDLLAAVVQESLQPQPGDTLLDLYGGVGLFALIVGRRAGSVTLVEGDRVAAGLARENLAGIGERARVHRGDVGRWLAGYRGPADLVVLDPPRTGAGPRVLADLHRLQPRRVAYVACDPAALARDLRIVLDLGWRLDRLQAFDMFPMTHHLECVASLSPARRAESAPA